MATLYDFEMTNWTFTAESFSRICGLQEGAKANQVEFSTKENRFRQKTRG